MQRSGVDEAGPHVYGPATTSLLEKIELPVEQASVLLSSGRRVEVEAGEPCDRVTMRSGSGALLLEIELGERGLRLRCSGAELELSGTEKLCLAARTVEIQAVEKLLLASDGDLTERIAGDHHSRVGGTERREAARVEVQANDGTMAIRARQAIRLDGEHIGLNDDPCPAPFAWSQAAEEQLAP